MISIIELVFSSEVIVVVQVRLHIHILSEMFVCLLCPEFHKMCHKAIRLLCFWLNIG